MLKNRTIYQVDAFTRNPFKGNPAGVMLVDQSVTAEWMQHMAAEMNLSETAFVIPEGTDFRIRFFTPGSEVALCGHATIASAHIIYETGLRKENETIRFKAKGGDLHISKEGGLIAMNFPEYPLRKISVPPDFKEIIGFEPHEVYSSAYNWIVAMAATENEVRSASPAFGRMVGSGLGHLMITAKSESEGVDFVVRCFAPSLGINEDPVTGSAHCALTPLWAKKLGIAEMVSLQVSKRQGQLRVKIIGDRVEIKGEAVTVFAAELKF